ncbi:30S ribosome-binding factor RbfA [Adhaeribacter pallidiroseus]|uniref:Ribosome-binding factor A n=1 Tax=Adhaeribacter pallidiroseus TaxID=2072847 RepID=A0A369QN08_9BACT|nr:30S ribosome-binding factor RbfA [Adhaeribacter pallidiroseus]RDC65740.1 Ribosome-binding factor [Adhaeribacter pallidiroseus]
MESKRQQKFAKLIQKELAEVFQRECSHLFPGAYVSVSVVRVSPDLGVAKVYLSLLMGTNAKELLQEIKINTKTIRHLLAQRIKKQVRVIPELIFFLDDTAEYAARMEQLFSGLDIPPADKEESSETNDEDK